MQKNILFYQANFDPEINRLLKAIENSDEKFKEIFKEKTLKIVSEVLRQSVKPAEKEEWSAVYNLVQDIEFATEEQKRILSTYGIPFSNKFAMQFN